MVALPNLTQMNRGWDTIKSWFQHKKQKWVQRAVGLDLMRAIAMWFIVILHSHPYAGKYIKKTKAPYRQDAVDGRFWGLMGVPMFSILTGYLCVGHKVQSFKLLFFILMVHFYVLVDFWHSDEKLNCFSLLKLVFPVLSCQYWYAQKYVVLQFLLPILNRGIDQLSNVSLCISSSVIFVFLALGQISSDLTHGLYKREDHTFFIVCGLYIIGATVRRVTAKWKAKFVMPGAALLLLADFWFYRHSVAWSKKPGLPKNIDRALMCHGSLESFVGATAMLLFFSKIEVSVPLWLNNLLNRSSYNVFAVYLIHVLPSFNQLVWGPYKISKYPQDKHMIKRLALNCVKVFFKCWLVDWARQFLFWLIEFKWLRQFCATKIDPFINQLDKPQTKPEQHLREA